MKGLNKKIKKFLEIEGGVEAEAYSLQDAINKAKSIGFKRNEKAVENTANFVSLFNLSGEENLEYEKLRRLQTPFEYFLDKNF